MSETSTSTKFNNIFSKINIKIFPPELQSRNYFLFSFGFQPFGEILQILTSIKAHLIVPVNIFGAAAYGKTALESPNYLMSFIKSLVVFL